MSNYDEDKSSLCLIVWSFLHGRDEMIWENRTNCPAVG